MPALIEVVTVIDAAPATVFDLELDVDVHAASLAGSRETASSRRRQLTLGDEVTFRARHFGLIWRMTSRISAYERPSRFVDEQTRGPFRAMRHEHLFEARGDGSTRMTDRLTITAPFGPLGAVVTRYVLAPYLERLLRKRGDYVKRAAETGRRVR
ncbi:SRPBCC family protein [Actinoplanes subglobosus]|uniref:SRPBCC family protein n=1 Tax=Actinoplanes subglobosus TaxID=1547892 RepID=A0ABV8IHA4_9ACTN